MLLMFVMSVGSIFSWSLKNIHTTTTTFLYLRCDVLWASKCNSTSSLGIVLGRLMQHLCLLHPLLKNHETLRIAEYQINWISNLQFMKALKVQKYPEKEGLKQTDQSDFSISCILLGDGSYYFLTVLLSLLHCNKDGGCRQRQAIMHFYNHILMDFIALWCLYAGDSFLLMYSL